MFLSVDGRLDALALRRVCVVVVVLVFVLVVLLFSISNRSFCPTSAIIPVSVLILPTIYEDTNSVVNRHR